jgi:hypothetical protein
MIIFNFNRLNKLINKSIEIPKHSVCMNDQMNPPAPPLNPVQALKFIIGLSILYFGTLLLVPYFAQCKATA